MALAVSCLTEMLDCLPTALFVITSALGDIITTEVRPLGESVLIQTLFSALYTKLIETADKDAILNKEQSTALSKSSICTTLAEAICSIDEDNKHTESIRSLILKSQTYVTAAESTGNEENEMDVLSSNPNSHTEEDLDSTARDMFAAGNFEYEVDSSDYISDLLCGDLLTTSVGRQSVKVSDSKAI